MLGGREDKESEVVVPANPALWNAFIHLAVRVAAMGEELHTSTEREIFGPEFGETCSVDMKRNVSTRSQVHANVAMWIKPCSVCSANVVVEFGLFGDISFCS